MCIPCVFNAYISVTNTEQGYNRKFNKPQLHIVRYIKSMRFIASVSLMWKWYAEGTAPAV